MDLSLALLARGNAPAGASPRKPAAVFCATAFDLLEEALHAGSCVLQLPFHAFLWVKNTECKRQGNNACTLFLKYRYACVQRGQVTFPGLYI